jgi:hypothetical protein
MRSISAALAGEEFGSTQLELLCAVDCAQAGQEVRPLARSARRHRQQMSNHALALGDFEIFALLQKPLDFRKAIAADRARWPFSCDAF